MLKGACHWHASFRMLFFFAASFATIPYQKEQQEIHGHRYLERTETKKIESPGIFILRAIPCVGKND